MIRARRLLSLTDLATGSAIRLAVDDMLDSAHDGEHPVDVVDGATVYADGDAFVLEVPSSVSDPVFLRVVALGRNAAARRRRASTRRDAEIAMLEACWAA